MGIGCPNYLNKGSNRLGLPVLNMAVIGYPKSGKSALIKQLGLDKQEIASQDCSQGCMQLQIGSFVLEKKVKVVAFEVSSASMRSWKYYYSNAHILLFVIDEARLQKQGQIHAGSILKALEEIDEAAPLTCNIVIVFSKCDLLSKDTEVLGQKLIINMLSKMKHQAITIKCSAKQGQGLHKLSQSIVSSHNSIHL